MNSADRVYLNGELLPRQAARISPFDRGFLYGDGFFETTRIEAGVPVFLDRHLRRMAASCAETGFGGALDVESIADGVRALVAANGVQAGYLRVTVSRGAYAGSLVALESEAPTIFAEARPMALPPLDAPAPVALIRSAYRRDERSPVVRHKSLSYQLNVLALAEGRKAGADEVYFLNAAGHLAEGAVTNLFFVHGGAVFTPDVACGLLPGVTRQVVLEVCAEEGVPAETGCYSEPELLAADEAFCTNSLRGVVGVRAILGSPGVVPPGGPVLARLQGAYAARVRQDCGRAGRV
jgi:branched-subunit amino acid aminotransferase/4-amino-4-deoxychorismate lyase